MRKCRDEIALPPADHVMHNLVDFAAEQRCDVILYSMNAQAAVEEIVFLRRRPPTQRPRGGDDTLRQNAVLVSAPGQALRVAMTPGEAQRIAKTREV